VIADKQLSEQSRSLVICCALALAAGLWGLYWVPQRWLDSAGLTGGWSAIAQYLVSLALLVPLALNRFRKGKQIGLNLPLAGLFMGGGIVCYANSFLLTEVMRTMLLFYLTPLWATLIEITLLKRRPGWWRIVSLPLSLLGVWIVIWDGSGLPLPANTGDWLALGGGAIYALGAARVQVSRVDGVFPILFAFFFYGSLVALLQSYLLAEHLGQFPESSTWLGVIPALLLLSVFFFIPTNAIISWAPTQMSTGLSSILILSELISGTISAALWANEAFGIRELMGSLFILSAGVLEVTLGSTRK